MNLGNFETFQSLVKNQNVNMADEETGRTALHYAAEMGNENFVDFLLKNGANVDITDKEGVSVLHFAALNSNYLDVKILWVVFNFVISHYIDNEKVLDMLINNEKLINKTTKKGNTPAHLAALNSKYR